MVLNACFGGCIEGSSQIQLLVRAGGAQCIERAEKMIEKKRKSGHETAVGCVANSNSGFLQMRIPARGEPARSGRAKSGVAQKQLIRKAFEVLQGIAGINAKTIRRIPGHFRVPAAPLIAGLRIEPDHLLGAP